MSETISNISMLTYLSQVFKRRETPLTLGEEAARKVGIILDNPGDRFLETPFFGVVRGRCVVDVIAPERKVQSVSPLVGSEEEGFIASVNRQELIEVTERARRMRRPKDSFVFGHTHPSGRVKLGPTTYFLSPSDSLLWPSLIGFGRNCDVAFLRRFISGNSGLHIPYIAIAANTEEGYKMRVYDANALIRVSKHCQLNRVKQTTYSLPSSGKSI